MKHAIIVLSMLLAATSMIGCSQVQEAAKDEGKSGVEVKPAPKQPVTISVLWSGREDQYKDRVENPKVKEKLPHVTFEYHNISEDLEKLITAGVTIDVMNVSIQNLYNMQRLNLTADMSSLIAKHKFDMSRFTPEHVEIMRKFSGNGQLVALPDKVNFPYGNFALAYNKDIFDKFGVSYPKDNMSWDEVINLSKQMHRTADGLQYSGLGYGSAPEMLQSLGLNYTNKEGKVDLSNPMWPEVLRVNKLIYDTTGKSGGAFAKFQKEKTVAMFAGNVRTLIEEATRNKADQPNWDVVTFPHFEGKPVTVPPVVGAYAVSALSKHKDEAFQTIALLLSDEMSTDILDLYLNPEFKKKNVNAMKAKQALYVAGEFDAIGNRVINLKVDDMNSKGKDINTVLRELQDETQKAVNESK